MQVLPISHVPSLSWQRERREWMPGVNIKGKHQIVGRILGQNREVYFPGGGGTPMMNPQHVPVNRPPFLNCHYPDDPLFLLCWPILNSMTPFFTFLKSWMTPLFYHFLLPNCPPFSSKSWLPNGPPFFTVAFVYLSMIDRNFSFR